MTVGISCSECGSEVVFLIEDKATKPTEKCDECGTTYRLKVEKVSTPFLDHRSED